METPDNPPDEPAPVATHRDRTQPIPSSLEKVKGYNTLTIYKMPASPYWYVRYYENHKIYRRSTKTEDKKKAIAAAKQFFADLKTRRANTPPLNRQSGFEICAWGLLKENEGRAARDEIAQTKIEYDRARLVKDLLPYFGKYEIAEIDYAAISGYLTAVRTEARPLTTNSLKIHLSHIKTILRYAQRMGVITALPAFPTLKTVDTPRGWLNGLEYNKLHNTARANIGKTFNKVIAKGEQRRNITLTQELYDLILFMTNTFVRPTDIKILQHKHITIVQRDSNYLRLSHPATKDHASPMVSMPAAIDTYKRILVRQRKEGFGRPDDFVFQPQHAANRAYAMRQLHRQFDQLLNMTGLKVDAYGQSRSLYSLRHTAIMFRLLNSQNLNPLTLARGSRTSFEVIDRFYAKHLTAEMDVESLQSLRPKRETRPERSPRSGRKKADEAPSGD